MLPSKINILHTAKGNKNK